MNTSRSPLGREYYERLDESNPWVSGITCCGHPVNTADRICPHCNKEISFQLVGTHPSGSEKYRWLLYREGETKPIKALICGMCHIEITTANRQCDICKAFYYIDFSREYTFPLERRDPCGWALLLDANHDYENAKQPIQGIQVIYAENEALRVTGELFIDTSQFDNLELGYLECPACGGLADPRNLDPDNRCVEHKLDISAMLVRWPNGLISVERHAWDYVKQNLFQKIVLCRLDCPKCHAPITDKHLRCLQCGFIVDVGYERHPIQNVSGVETVIHTQVKLMLRWPTERPEGLLKIVEKVYKAKA